MFNVLNKKSFVSYPSRVKMVVPHNFNTRYMGGVHWMEIVESGQQFLNRGMFKTLINLVSLEPFHSNDYIICTVYIISVLFITLKLLLNKMRLCFKRVHRRLHFLMQSTLIEWNSCQQANVMYVTGHTFPVDIRAVN